MSTVIMIADHTGYADRNARLTTALSIATTIATNSCPGGTGEQRCAGCRDEDAEQQVHPPPCGVVGLDDQAARRDQEVLVVEERHEARYRMEDAEHHHHGRGEEDPAVPAAPAAGRYCVPLSAELLRRHLGLLCSGMCPQHREVVASGPHPSGVTCRRGAAGTVVRWSITPS
ncbi:hypothetical protein [Aeromicrobium sp. UC242_57]|uniref:hypothetical protein n=1 Tax=Aeromicrobium sp. UC242_57 TaxID=3374624 RepID=UPI0037A0F033